MTYCLNLNCPRDKRQNPPGTKYCLDCGSKLLLKDLYAATDPLRDGGFGRTFKAVNYGKFEELCVIKQLSPSQEFQRKLEHFKKYVLLFEQEARRLYELKHPQISQLISYFEEGGRLYLVQEQYGSVNTLNSPESPLASPLIRGTQEQLLVPPLRRRARGDLSYLNRIGCKSLLKAII